VPQQADYIAAHTHSANHRDEVLRSAQCGCFHCLSVFAPAAISEWVDEVDGTGTTAMCPRCGIDSVIGDASGFPMDRAFLKGMQMHWFL
jgi:hypothetical protein